MKVRVAKESDINVMIDIARQFNEEAPNYSNRKLDQDVLSENLLSIINGMGTVFVVEHQNNIIGGIVCLTTKDWFNNDLIAFEQVFYIKPEFRTSRASYLLLDAFISWSKHMGANRIQCGTSTGINTKGCLRLYERFGFREYGILLDLELKDE